MRISSKPFTSPLWGGRYGEAKRSRIGWGALCAAVLFLALLPLPAFAQDDTQREGISDFNSEILVHTDGSLAVTETIKVVALGFDIRRGIYRDFPTTYIDKLGRHVRVRFDVTAVTRDGAPEPYTTGSLSNGVRVKIGSADTDLESGPHTYTIAYTTNRQIGFFDDYDELYWNVTGNGWGFYIQHAGAVIHLPPGARIKQYAFYTGAQGATGQDATADRYDDTDIGFETTAPLAPREGLTIAVGFAKGVIAPPTQTEETENFLRDNASIGIAMLGLIALAVLYGFAWWSFGRDPSGGTIIPLFAPPKGFSPAAVRYVHRMAYDRKSFAASLIDMAVKGYLKIAEVGGEYSLTRTAKSEAECGLASVEVALAKALFVGPDDTIELKQTNHTRIAAAISMLKRALQNEYEFKYFVTNQGWFIGGLIILGVSGVGAALMSDDPGPAAFLLVWMSGWSIGTAFLLHRAAANWYSVWYGPGSRFLNFFGAVFMSAFAVPFVGGMIFALFAFAKVVSPLVMLCLAAGGFLAYIFYHLLKAPTLMGARSIAEIDGFKIFLETAEKDRLEALNPPQITPAVFERFLPYAIALDCENSWSKKFEAEAAAAAAAGDPSRGSAYAYAPIWYSGGSFDRLGAGGFASAIGSSIAGAAASASTAPGSSSGSGGGGFSGGGGGGGGGGGW